MTDNIKNFGKKNIFITGRATTGLYLIFLKEKIRDKKVLFPANICYAPVFAAVFAGNRPVFVDIADWANTSLNKIKACIDDNVACIVLPHMYGKVVKEIEDIADFCEERGILLVEDCASALGATYDGKPVGSFGKYSIFSFGYSKIIDVGLGGIIASDEDLSCFEELQKDFPLWTKDKEDSLGMFSKLYRVMRNSKDNSLLHKIYKSLPNYMNDYFIYQISGNEKQRVIDSITTIEYEKERRWVIYDNLKNRIKNKTFEICNYEKGDIPWRFSFLYKGSKEKFVSLMLEKSVPISDWYPFIGTMFGEDNKLYVNTVKIEKIIYNIPLVVNAEWIELLEKCNNMD